MWWHFGSEQVGHFEPQGDMKSKAIGEVWQHDETFDRLAHGGEALDPDLVVLYHKDSHRLWVWTKSVYCPSGTTLQKLDNLEVLAIWDYAGKIWYQTMSTVLVNHLIFTRLLSPPTKIITTISFTLFQHFIEDTLPKRVQHLYPWTPKCLWF